MSGPVAAMLRFAPVLLVVLTLYLVQGYTSAAQTSTALGIDVIPGGNTATLVIAVDTCVEVDVGVQFQVDIYITDVQDLRAWELRFAFDHNVVRVVDYDYFLFLGSVHPTLFEAEPPDVEKADRYFLAAAETRDPDSGSGVLARLTLEAVGPGRSPAAIAAGIYAPILSDINDPRGEDKFTGPVSQAEIAVAEPCSAPAPDPSPTSPPADNTTPGSDTDANDAPDGTSSAAVVLLPPGDGDQGEAGTFVLPLVQAALSDSPPASPSSESATGDTSATGGTSATDDGSGVESPPGVLGGDAEPSADEVEDGAAPGGRRITVDAGSSNGFSLWTLGAILAVAAVLGAGGTVITLILRNRP